MHERRVVAGLLGCLAWVTPAAAQTDDFYKGKTITVIAGFSPGGGYDAYDRVFARHLAKHVPGQPAVVVQNMPGAGSLTAVRSLDRLQPQDGTVMLTFNPGLVTHSVVEPENVGFDFRRFSWIGIFTPDFRVCWGFGSNGVRSWSDLMSRKQFVVGTTGKGAGAYINESMLRDVFGAPIKQIVGFPGSAEQQLAIERGELDGDCGTFSSIPEAWLKGQVAHPFVRFTRDRQPEIPESAVYINDIATSAEQIELLDFLDTENELGRLLVMSGQVPGDRVALMRRGFTETMKDEDFLAETRRMRLPVDPRSGIEAEQIVARFSRASPRVIEKARAIFK